MWNYKGYRKKPDLKVSVHRCPRCAKALAFLVSIRDHEDHSIYRLEGDLTDEHRRESCHGQEAPLAAS